jgi:hypothetical protein
MAGLGPYGVACVGSVSADFPVAASGTVTQVRVPGTQPEQQQTADGSEEGTR